MAIAGDHNYEIWTSVFDEIDDVQIVGYPRNLELLEPVANHPSVQRLQWFTKGQYKAWESGDQIFLSDLRMGIEGSYIFNFEVAKRENDGMVTGSFAQLEQRPQLSRMTEIWQRIFDPSVGLSRFSDRNLK